MILIAHRGNTNGKNDMENHPSYLELALNLGYYVETDVWFINDLLYLGHDKPKYPVLLSFLENDKIICHCKNMEALEFLIKNPKIHCFYHDKDDYTITSKGWIWCYSMKPVPDNGIMVMPNINDKSYLKQNILKCKGICCDNLNIAYKLERFI